MITSALLGVLACSGEPSAPSPYDRLSGAYTLDSIDGRKLPDLKFTASGDSVFVTSLTVTIDPATSRSLGVLSYAASERDSTVIARSTTNVKTVTYGGVYVLGPDVLLGIGRDSVLVKGVGDGPGPLLGDTGFAQRTDRGVMYFSRR